VERLRPHLDTWAGQGALVRLLPDYRAGDVKGLLDEWAAAGLLLRRGSTPRCTPDTPLVPVLMALGLEQDDIEARLGAVRIGLFGEGRLHGLIRGSLETAGFPRVEAYASGAEEAGEGGSLPLSRERVEALAADLEVLVCVSDRGQLAARHWVNRAAIATGRPALFAELELTQAFIGPLVLPGEGPCYMCYRMRRIAMSEAFADAFAYEQHLDRSRRADVSRPVLPGLAETAAGLVVLELVKLLFGPLTPSLSAQVAQLDGLTLAFQRHEVLPRPDCPHCAGVLSAVRVGLV
jgi:bacteriocin biosynthesis cyclodehydratase domain-containing protein